MKNQGFAESSQIRFEGRFFIDFGVTLGCFVDQFGAPDCFFCAKKRHPKRHEKVELIFIDLRVEFRGCWGRKNVKNSNESKRCEGSDFRVRLKWPRAR